MKKNSFVSGTIISTISIVLVKMMGMLYVIPFYSIVGSQGGALYSYAYQLYLLFLGVSSAGIPNAISKVISEYNSTGKLEAKTRAFHVGKKIISYISIAAFALLFIFAEELATIYLGKITGGNTPEDAAFVIRCVSFAVLIIPHLSVTKGYLQGHQVFEPSSVANLLEQIVRIFIILAGSFLAYKVFNSSLSLAVGIEVSGAFFGGLIAYLYLRRKIKKYSKELDLGKEIKKDNVTNKEITKKIISYAVPFVIINIVVDIYNIIDSVLILNTLTSLGYVAEDVEFIASCISTWGSKICMIVNAIAMGMTTSLIPSIVEAYSTKNIESLNKRVNEALQMVFYIALPLAIGISILSTPIWTIFYNTNAYGGSILKVTIFGAMLGNIAMILSVTLQGMNKYKYVYSLNIIGSLVNAILDVPLMILFHKLNLPAYYGASTASIIGYGTSILLGLKYVNQEKNINYKETLIVILKSLIPALSMTFVLLILNHFLPLDLYKRVDSFIIIIIDAIVGGFIFIFISFKLKLPQKIFGKKYLNKIIKKLTLGKLKID